MSNKEFLETCESEINDILKRDGMIKVSKVYDILGIDNYDKTNDEYYLVYDANGMTLKHISELHLTLVASFDLEKMISHSNYIRKQVAELNEQLNKLNEAFENYKKEVMMRLNQK